MLIGQELVKTVKISELIKHLRTIKKEFGDRPIALSKDAEGNSFGNIDPERIYYSFGAYDGMVIIYPERSGLDLEDFADYKKDEGA